MTGKKKKAAPKKKAAAKKKTAKRAAPRTPKVIQRAAMPYNVGAKTVTVVIDGKPHTVSKNPLIAEALKAKDWNRVAELCAPAQALHSAIVNYDQGAASGYVRVSPAGLVTFKNRAINNASARRISELMKEGYPIESELRTLESLMRHDDPRVIEAFEDYLDRWHIPRLDDGRIVLVKGVRRTDTPGVFASQHDAKFLYTIGQSVTEDWNTVDRNPANACSRGIHACPLAHVRSYYSESDATHALLELAVWPENIAALPNDYKTEGKVRLVEAFVTRELPPGTKEIDLTGRA